MNFKNYLFLSMLLFATCENQTISGKKFFETTVVDYDGTIKNISYYKAHDKNRLLFVIEQSNKNKIDTICFNEATIHSDLAGSYLFNYYCNSNAVGGGNFIWHKASELGLDSFYVFIKSKVDSGLGSQIEYSDAATIWHYIRGMGNY